MGGIQGYLEQGARGDREYGPSSALPWVALRAGSRPSARMRGERAGSRPIPVEFPLSRLRFRLAHVSKRRPRYPCAHWVIVKGYLAYGARREL